jgi:hypothetical protein
LQCGDDRPLGQLKGNRDWATIAPVQRRRPLVNACYLVGDAVELVIGITNGLQANVVLGICPVDADIGRELPMR